MNTPAKLLPVNHAWKTEQSLDLYQVEAWGKGYFSINDAGHVVIRPSMDAAREIDLFEVVQGLKARDLHTPVVIRFSDILAHRLRHLAEAFGTAIAENDYKNRYAAVFPIKVNQQRLVVEEVYRYGKEFGFGLEVGSKPELLAVMSITEDAPDRIVVCNGFKDDSYIEAVILATKLGRTIIPVVENYEEIHLILKHAERYGVRPKIGVRVKLASEGAGRWRESAGEKSKFGLFISEILDLYALLKDRDMLDCLQLVHCHPGSQLQDIRRALAQGRDLQVDDVEPEQQVFAEGAFAHGVGQIAVRGRDDADIDRHRPCAADPIDHALLDGAQQFGLQPDIHFGNFVQQQRAAGGFLELSDPPRHGTGEGALLVAEQFGLQQVFGDRRAID